MAIRPKKKEANSFRLAKKYSSYNHHTDAHRHTLQQLIILSGTPPPIPALCALYRLQECDVSLVIYKHTHNKRAAAV